MDRARLGPLRGQVRDALLGHARLNQSGLRCLVLGAPYGKGPEGASNHVARRSTGRGETAVLVISKDLVDGGAAGSLSRSGLSLQGGHDLWPKSLVPALALRVIRCPPVCVQKQAGPAFAVDDYVRVRPSVRLASPPMATSSTRNLHAPRRRRQSIETNPEKRLAEAVPVDLQREAGVAPKKLE